ncbi:sensor histidine kinase [Haloplanus sp. GCM10025708]|uniref:sensor histidine kinase n=1 Tax=Haloplanus sp. GCM10025708 TaxID=3252679 RepID=UPI003608CFC9
MTLAREGVHVGEFESVDLGKLIKNCWQTVPTAEATLVTDTDREIQADSSRLEQLVENLIRNAVEHGGNDVTITIGDIDDGFYVADDGPGIPEDEREQVFESGYSTAKEGSGFGLSIVKEIVDAHRWNIRVVESETGGARFEITDVTFTAE